MTDTPQLATALVGIVAGFTIALAFFHVALFRAVLLSAAAAAIVYAYLYSGGVDGLLLRGAELIAHIDNERRFWLGVGLGKGLALLLSMPHSRRA